MPDFSVSPSGKRDLLLSFLPLWKSVSMRNFNSISSRDTTTPSKKKKKKAI